MKKLFTIGYSSYDIATFISVLNQNKIEAIVDVRSSPSSKYKPEYNSEALKKTLNNVNIAYVFLGEECGARSKDESCYIDGRVDYELISRTALFKRGIERIINGLEKYNIALMCAEIDPITCHRNILICRSLKEYKMEIFHILGRGIVESNTVAELRLLKKFNLDIADFFWEIDERLETVYKKQGSEIAYRKEQGEGEEHD